MILDIFYFPQLLQLKEIHIKSVDALLQLLLSTFERIHKSYIVDITEVVKLKVNP